MDVILKTRDGEELMAVIADQRGNPPAIHWRSSEGDHVFLPSDPDEDGKLSGNYQEVVFAPVLSFTGVIEVQQ